MFKGHFVVHWFTNHTTQGRNKVRWRQEKEASVALPCSSLRSFGSKCTVLKKVLVKLLGLFGALRSDLVPRKLFPLTPLTTPLIAVWGGGSDRAATLPRLKIFRASATCSKILNDIKQCFSTFFMSRPTFRRDFCFGPTSRKMCFRTYD